MTFTPRQTQIIRLVARGETTKAIAQRLGLSERTVKFHLTRLYEALGVENRAGLIARVMADAGLGLVEAKRATAPAGVEADAAAYDDAPFMVAIADLDLRYTYVNRMAERVVGRSARELIGARLFDVYPDFPEPFRSAIEDVLRTGTPWGIGATPVRFLTANGSERRATLNVMYAPLRDRGGAIAGVLAIGTERERRSGH